MATLVPGDVISTRPTQDTLAAGLLLYLPKRNCRVLALDTGGSYGGFPPRAADKTALLAYLTGKGINIPETFRTTDWGVAGYPLVGRLNRTLCPWGDHD